MSNVLPTALELPLVDRQEIADGTWEFWIERGAYTFTPGQHATWSVPHLLHDDPRGNHRIFSIASRPDENRLLIATRRTGSGFKETLIALPLRTRVSVTRPIGNMVLPGDDAPLVMIAGGIGITPFRSMLAHAAATHRPGSITLLYANRTRASSAFVDDLDAFVRQNTALRVIHVVSDDPSPPPGWRTGRIDAALIEREIPDHVTARFFLAGPPGLVEAMQQHLTALRIAPDRIQFERFTGY